MEKKLDSDEVIVDISDAEKQLNSRNPNGEIEIEKQEFGSNIDVVQVNQDSGLGSRTPKVTPPVTPKGKYDDEDGDFPKILQANHTRKRHKKIKLLFVMEFTLFVCITLVLILSNVLNTLKKKEIWSVGLWIWCVLALAVFCGRMFSKWLMNLIVVLIKKNNFLKHKILYFVYDLQKNVRVFIWLCLILLAWVLLITRGARTSRDTKKILNYITRGIASTLVVAGAWMLRTLLVRTLAAQFHINRFSNRIQESIYHQHILQTLSGVPKGINSFTKQGEEQSTENVIDMQKIKKMKRTRIYAWTMRDLLEVVKKSVFANEDGESEDDVERYEQTYATITSDLEAITAAEIIFKNVAKHGQKYIEEDDLLRFMHKDEVWIVLGLIEGGPETGKIKKKLFANWVVNVCKERKSIAVSLSSTKTAIAQLNRFISGITVAVLLILWIIIMGIASTEVLLFITSQFLLAIFSFGATAISALEAMIFVFLKHPFDVGDRCVVDGVQVVVEEVSILTTIFLRYDNEKIYYPNSVLATKSISNFNRSPYMSDTVEFDLDVSTPIEKISALKAKIKGYIESKPELWSPKHSVRVREIEDANKLKMNLCVTHTMNFQDYDEKSDRRSNLVLELKRIFEDLGVKYHILPQKISD